MKKSKMNSFSRLQQFLFVYGLSICLFSSGCTKFDTHKGRLSMPEVGVSVDATNWVVKKLIPPQQEVFSALGHSSRYVLVHPLPLKKHGLKADDISNPIVTTIEIHQVDYAKANSRPEMKAKSARDCGGNKWSDNTMGEVGGIEVLTVTKKKSEKEEIGRHLAIDGKCTHLQATCAVDDCVEVREDIMKVLDSIQLL